MKNLKKEWNIERICLLLMALFFIMTIFAVLDFYTHELKEECAVPDYYFKNKLIYGTLWGLVGYAIARNLSPLKKALVVSIVISTLLQVKYFFEGYPKSMVFLFLIGHFIMVFPPSWWVFSYTKNEL